MTLLHTTKLVRVWWKDYLWSRHCDRGRRDSETNPSKHSSRPISSEELCRQETQSLGVSNGWSCIPSSLPNEGVRRFSIKGKLAPRYIGPYHIVDMSGPMSYQVELPTRLSGVHNVFHVFQLKRCMKPPTYVSQLKRHHPIGPDLTYKAYPIKVLDQ
jgi:hypothetical protein